ncbi:MAG: glycosyltransferase family 2 protein [Aeromonas sp.]
MSNPKVSVLMPCYNAEKYISDAVISIKKQSFKDFKIIILDDASEDGTLKIVKELAVDDDRFCILQNKSNQGIAKSRDKLLSMVDTEFFAWMDADDISHPDRLSIQYAYLKMNGDVGVISSWANILGENKTCNYFPSKEMSQDEIKATLLLHNIICNPVAMVRYSVFKKSKFSFSDCGVVSATDYAFWVELLKLTKIEILNEVLLEYRIHPTQESSKNFKNQKISAKKISLSQFLYHGVSVKYTDEYINDIFLYREDKPKFKSPRAIGKVYKELINKNKSSVNYCNEMLENKLSIAFARYCKFFGIKGFIAYVRYMGINNLLNKKSFGLDLFLRCLFFKY